MLAVTILGSNSAVPAHERHPTSQLLQTGHHHFLIDCGEGTQLRLTAFKLKPLKISHIFISHLHGDHYFGLIGLLTTMGLNQRSQDLHIFSPKPLEPIIKLQFAAADAHLPYPIIFHELASDEIILEDEYVIVESFTVKHRIECFGFIFREKKKPRKIKAEKVEYYDVPISFYEQLQNGADFTLSDGSVIANDQLTAPGSHAKSYAYCADTTYYEPLSKKVKDVDMIYHEATYLHELKEKANGRFHSTALQAAMIAKAANTKKLLLGHYSSMYTDISVFQKEAAEIFPETECAEEGVCYLV